jgi:hypothetical protein
VKIDPSALTDFLVDIYEDLKTQNQEIAILRRRLDAICQALSATLPGFDRIHEGISRTLVGSARPVGSVEGASYDEAIRKLKSGEHLVP